MTNKIKLYEKDIGRLKKELSESSNTRNDERETIERELGKKCKDNEEKITQLRLELAVLENENQTLQKSSKTSEQELQSKVKNLLQINSLNSLNINSLKQQIENTLDYSCVESTSKASKEAILLQEMIKSANEFREEFSRLLEESKENTMTLEKRVEHLTRENVDLQGSVKNTLRLYSLLVRASKGFSFDNVKTNALE